MANEKRLIDANALMDAFRKYMAKRFDKERCVSEENCKVCDRECLWRRIVKDAPTVDAVEVVHGEWVVCGDGEYVPFMCSACGKTTSWYHKQTANYCPNCGAKMDGGKDK